MPPIATSDPIAPTDAEAEIARESSRKLGRHVSDDTLDVTIAGTKERIRLPRSAVRLLVDLLAEMARGNAITIIPIHAELTTQQAADLLNVSRPFLVKELESNRLPFRKVGTHRRILYRDLLSYKKAGDARRRAAVKRLAAIDEELDES